jgi:hypothetical protein
MKNYREKRKASGLTKLEKARYIKTPRGRAVALFQRAKNRSKKYNLEFNLTTDWILEKLNNKKCELTEIAFSYETTSEFNANPFAPSLDRKDSNKGYTKENTRVVLVCVNTALGEYGEDIVLPILVAMVKGIRKNAKAVSTT